jgi:hypothetical protein
MTLNIHKVLLIEISFSFVGSSPGYFFGNKFTLGFASALAHYNREKFCKKFAQSILLDIWTIIGHISRPWNRMKS